METEITLPDGAPKNARLDDGLWSQVFAPTPPSTRRPALFLDRDGAVVVEAQYLQDPDKVALIDGAADVVTAANARDIPVVLVTNQAGIGYGYFGWQEFINVQERLLAVLAQHGGRIDGVFACPFHVKGKPPYQHPDHPGRKPNPGMLRLAAERMNLDLSASWIVGDRRGDLGAGKNAGCAGGLHVLTGHGSKPDEREQSLALGDETFQAIAGDSIKDALATIPLLA